MSDGICVLMELKERLINDRKKVSETYSKKDDHHRYFGYVRAITIIDELMIEVENE